MAYFQCGGGASGPVKEVLELKYNNGNTGESTYTIPKAGTYLIAVVYSLAGSGSITLPQGVTALYSGSVLIGSGSSEKGLKIVVASLHKNDVITMQTSVSNWTANAKLVIKLPFDVTSLIDSGTASDSKIEFNLSSGSGRVLCVAVAWARIQTSGSSNAQLWDLTEIETDMDCIAGVVGTNCLLRAFICDAADFPMVKAYGYDGGGVAVAVLQ